MAWYKELIEQGIIVRSEVIEDDNSFPIERTIQYEKKGSKFKLDSNKKKIPILDAKGNYTYIEELCDRDCYIECATPFKKDRIYCLTTDNGSSKIEDHVFLAYMSNKNKGMNFLKNVLSSKMNIEKLENEQVVEEIEKIGVFYDIEITDVELLFKTKDIELLTKLMKAKRLKGKAPSPFESCYYIWDKYEINEKDLEKYKKARIFRFGDYEPKTTEFAIANKEMGKLTKKFMEDNDITLDAKRKIRIEGNREAIHKLGLWSKYIKTISN
jgi:hypothetical protein